MLGMVRTLFPGYCAEKDERMAVTTKTKQKSDKATTCAESPEQLSATTECCGIESCQDSIREKAYLLWEAAGSPPGDGVEFWVQAEKELS